MLHQAILRRSVPFVLASVAAIALSLTTMIGPGVARGIPANSDQIDVLAADQQSSPHPIADSRSVVFSEGASTAHYVVHENTLGGGLSHEVDGAASDVSGKFVIDTNGSVIRNQSQISVDLRSLRTDEPARDQIVRATTLATDQYPTSSFTATSLEGLNPWPTRGDANFRACGQLTLHGSARPLCLNGVGHFAARTISGSASGELSMTDFGINPPQLGPLVAIDDKVELRIEFRADVS